MDVKNAFLYGDLDEIIYMRPTQGLPGLKSTNVCKVWKSFYGLRQEPHAWFAKFQGTIIQAGFNQSQFDPSMFLQQTSAGVTILLDYVDDIIITRSDSLRITKLQDSLQSFHMKDLGYLTYFLGL